MDEDVPLSDEHIETLYKASAKAFNAVTDKTLEVETCSVAITACATASILIELHQMHKTMKAMLALLERQAASHLISTQPHA